MHGYFEIGIFQPKTEENVGTLYRSAYQLGATGIFIIGKKFKSQCTDTCKSHLNIPLREYKTFDEYYSNLPYDCQLIGIEMGGRKLRDFCHPIRASYLLGNEAYGLPKEIQSKCKHILSLDSVRANSYNVSVSGSLVMYHRQFLG